MIDSFTAKYGFLSSFYVCLVELDGLTYRTVEHAYNAAKTLNERQRFGIKRLFYASDAKKAGRKVTLRPDWEEVKLEVMKDLVRQKFSKGLLRRKLLATKDQELIEGNWWGDRFWGVCKGSGHNHLGRILMEVRDELTLGDQ